MENSFQFYEGQDLTFQAPSGHTFTIREQNGDDDEILSRINPEKREENIKNLNIFLSKIIKTNSVNNKEYLQADEVNKLKLKDKYYILLKSRLHSIGTELKFTAPCPKKGCECENNFVEDLTKYDTDLSKYDEKDPKYKYQITPYPDGKATDVEFTLSTGKKLQYTYINVGAEYAVTQMENISNNTQMQIRGLKMWNSTTAQFQTLGSYNVFSKKEMIEIDKHMADYDPQFMMFMELECPKCGFKWEIPFLYLKDFFFPGEI